MDNDVNWAPQAERDNAPALPLSDFAHIFLGDGLGAAIIGWQCQIDKVLS